jgi:glycosyltransferase involved in cell wall biosynthesis
VRVVYLHQYFLTPDGSGGTRSYEMARRLVAKGHCVHVITSEQQPSPNSPIWRTSLEAGIQVHWTPVPYSNALGFMGRMLAFVLFAWRASFLAARLPADVIFATSTPLSIAIPAMWASFRQRRPFVFEIRDQWPDVPIALGILRNPLLILIARSLERATYRCAAAIVTLAPGMRDDIIARGVPSEKVVVIPNGCDNDLFAESVDALVQPQHAWVGSGPLVVFAGTFGAANGVDYAVRLAAEVRKIAADVRFILIGDGAQRCAVEALAQQLGVLGSSVHFTGRLPKRTVANWLRAADLTLALFAGPRVVWKDAVQNKFFDSLAAGRPVASNFQGWQSELAVQEGVGIILPATDASAAAEKLVAALRDLDWIAAARIRARTLAHTRFNRDALAHDLEQVLLRVGAQGARS